MLRYTEDSNAVNQLLAAGTPRRRSSTISPRRRSLTAGIIPEPAEAARRSFPAGVSSESALLPRAFTCLCFSHEATSRRRYLQKPPTYLYVGALVGPHFSPVFYGVPRGIGGGGDARGYHITSGVNISYHPRGYHLKSPVGLRPTGEAAVVFGNI